MRTSAYLKPEVRFAWSGADLICLDLRRDSYSAIREAKLKINIQVATGEVSGDLEAVATLEAEGLLTWVPGAHRPVAPQVRAPRSDLLSAPDDPSVALAWSMVNAGLGLALQAPGRSLGARLARGAPASLRAYDEPPRPGLLAVAVALGRRQVYNPFPGACVCQNDFARRVYRAKGYEAVWVVGVRTWPFEAHCWLQHGDVVLNDGVERVAAFSPIVAR